jgi:Co/Zn/Cd efflux system component
VRWAIALGAVYVAADLLFSLEMGARGLLSPGGDIHPDAVVIGLACIAARVGGRFAVPAILAFGLARVAAEPLARLVAGGRGTRG